MCRIIAFILCFIAINAWAGDITGIVVDEHGDKLPYSIVRIKGKRIAALGDSTGRFTLPMKRVLPGDTITISYLGYESKQIAVSQLTSDDMQRFELSPSSVNLQEVTVMPSKKAKIKRRVKGKKHSGGMFSCLLDDMEAGESYGFEFHAKENKRLILNKVGFYYIEGDSAMTRMKFRVNVYDMSKVTGSPTRDFINVLSKPIYFEFVLGEEKSGKFEYRLPEPIALPQDAMVEIEFLEALDHEILWFKCNMVGKPTWGRLVDGVWSKDPYSTPFFAECLEIDSDD